MKRRNNSPVRKIVRSIDKMATLPMIYTSVNELVDSPTSSASDLGKVISADQGFTASLLKLVNSAFYGFPSRIDTVSRAVTIIGFKQLRELVLATSVMSMFKDMGKGISLNMEEFWKHSIGCGLASRILAIYGGLKNPESYFVAGLLHDIGRMVLLDKYMDKYAEVLSAVKEEDLLVFEAEMDILGFTHADVAEELVSLVESSRYAKDRCRVSPQSQPCQEYGDVCRYRPHRGHTDTCLRNRFEWGTIRAAVGR